MDADIVEYPMFVDSALSKGIQLADLCGYNIYRAFREQNFSYSYFNNTLARFYCSKQTSIDKLDGLKVWPEDSDLANSGATRSLRSTPRASTPRWCAWTSRLRPTATSSCASAMSGRSQGLTLDDA